MHFERQVRRTRSVPLTPLIDVMFFLLVFFMLSTNFTRTESLELMLPHAKGEKVSADKLLQVYITKAGQMFAGRKPVEEDELTDILSEMVTRTPDVHILLLSGPGVSVQQLVTVMDRIYLSGGKNLSVASWKPGKTVGQGE